MIEVLGMAELGALNRPILSIGWIVNDHWYALGRSMVAAMLCFKVDDATLDSLCW